MLNRVKALRPLAGALLAVALAAVLPGALAGCGGSSSNGIASKSAAEILSASKAAALSANSVHLNTTTGEVVLDVKLSSGGGIGRLSLSGSNLDLLRIGSTFYLKAPAVMYQKIGINAKVPPDVWLKTTVGTIPNLVTFTEMKEQLSRLLNVSPVTKGAITTVNRQKVVELRQKLKVFTRSLYVAVTGKPYPVEILLKGQVAGNTTLSDWNKPVTLTPPSKSLEISKVPGSGH
jgi:hypothetical protein